MSADVEFDLADIPTDTKEKAVRLLNLYIELTEAEQQKKDAVAAFKENIDRIKDEIKELFSDEEEDADAVPEVESET